MMVQWLSYIPSYGLFRVELEQEGRDIGIGIPMRLLRLQGLT